MTSPTLDQREPQHPGPSPNSPLCCSAAPFAEAQRLVPKAAANSVGCKAHGRLTDPAGGRLRGYQRPEAAVPPGTRTTLEPHALNALTFSTSELWFVQALLASNGSARNGDITLLSDLACAADLAPAPTPAAADPLATLPGSTVNLQCLMDVDPCSEGDPSASGASGGAGGQQSDTNPVPGSTRPSTALAASSSLPTGRCFIVSRL